MQQVKKWNFEFYFWFSIKKNSQQKSGVKKIYLHLQDLSEEEQQETLPRVLSQLSTLETILKSIMEIYQLG